MPPQDQTPVTPMGMNPNPTPSMYKSVGIIIVAFVALLILSIFMMKWSGIFVANAPASQKEVKNPYTQDKVIVKNADLTKGLPAREVLPAAFSKELPLPKDAKVTNSSVSNYTEKKVILSVFSYTTTQTQAEIYALYDSYMTGLKFVFGVDGKKNDRYLSGTKNNDDLTVTIDTNGKETTVTVSFLDRK